MFPLKHLKRCHFKEQHTRKKKGVFVKQMFCTNESFFPVLNNSFSKIIINQPQKRINFNIFKKQFKKIYLQVLSPTLQVHNFSGQGLTTYQVVLIAEGDSDVCGSVETSHNYTRICLKSKG